MMMKISMGPSMRLKVRQEARLTQSQIEDVEVELLHRQRALVSALYGGDQFAPKADCSMCGHHLTDREIMREFRDDPTDFTTGCPNCKYRFLPKLFRSTLGGSVETPFFCPVQTLERLRGLENVPFEDFQTGQKVGIYQSAVAHFGGLKQAFAGRFRRTLA